ncbi:MAG: CCA tRNA nucleotidyltransferase [Fimbriimonadaceae bacterium]|nr:CCA tRNA nucleotidyltransferase [Fimbriimonadaceae bacterium]
MHRAIEMLAEATKGTPYEGALWLVGGAVRDPLLGRPVSADLDLVTELSAVALAELLFERGTSSIAPVTYPRFGTALVRIEDADVELVTARAESYDPDSRKPEVRPATLEEDARRRDFTVNTLIRNVHTGDLRDPLGCGLEDLEAKVLRTPLPPDATFRDDPLRMLRAVRLRWQLGFEFAEGLEAAIRAERGRLSIISAERYRDELLRMLRFRDADQCLADLMRLGLFDDLLPEFVAMVGVEQGGFHHLDVWDHSLLVVRNAGPGDLVLTLAALLHDVGKPSTRSVDEEGATRFFGHEIVGEKMTWQILNRLRVPHEVVESVARLVRGHMRLGSAPVFTPAAARRVLRDLGEDTERLLALVEADASALKPGVRAVDLGPIRRQLEEAEAATPREVLVSPLTGAEIMEVRHLEPGPEVGVWKRLLTEQVLEGTLAPGDRDAALQWLKAQSEPPKGVQ